MVFNSTFLYRGGKCYWWPGGTLASVENHRHAAIVTDKLYHIMLYRVHLA